MIRTACICAALAMGGLMTAAGDFSLTFHTIPAKEAMSFPGGYGSSGQVRLAKPTGVKKEPSASCAKPLYGECGESSAAARFLFRLEETQGDGKGYDQLIVDMNQNGDLTDDPVVKKVVLPTDRKASASGQEQALFGPVEAPAGKLIAGGRPVYYAQVYLYNLQMLRQGRSSIPASQLANVYAGQLRLKAGWYLDTLVEMDGVKQRVGVYDGDGNMRLGDLSKARKYRNPGSEETWYFGPGDAVLLDVDGSGVFESDPFNSESCSLGPVVYFGAKPYTLTLATDNRSLRLEPWTDALAEVTLQPRGDQIRYVTLAREQPDDQWQLLRAGIADGRIQVPPGNYRLQTCVLFGRTGEPRDQVMASGYERAVKKPFAFKAGEANTLRCGGPLDIKVTADKRKPESWEMPPQKALDPKVDSEFVLRINAQVFGAEGEIYSSYGKGKDFKSDPPKPGFTVMGAGGKKLGNGNLEFG